MRNWKANHEENKIEPQVRRVTIETTPEYSVKAPKKKNKVN
jgi:type IV secretory pathway ATPase VirB11/archaellum biosynthesis ATPase